MLVTPEKRTVVGHIKGEHQAMQLDADSVPHLMELLSRGLYTNPEAAVLREYSCNARDANDEAGNPAPIEVTLPNTLSPFLTIKDQGIGLSWEDIQNVYSKYGASTKRVVGNEQTGSLGLGCKSGLTYTDQFTIMAVKDGVRAIVSVTRTEDGGGDMTLVEEARTDEANGVEISIPARRWNEFAQRAQEIFKYWPKGSVLVNGEEIEPVIESSQAQRIADDLYLIQEPYGKSYVVMANVAYPVASSDFGITVPHDKQLLAFVGIDEVDFAPSREAVRMSKKTKDTLTNLGQRFKDELLLAMQNDIDSAATTIEAMRKATKWYLQTPEGMRPSSWTYNGQEIPKEFAVGEADPTSGLRPNMIVVRRSSYKLKDHSRKQTMPFHTAVNAIWFYGYSTKFTSGQRRRINEWSNQNTSVFNGDWPEHYILCDAKPDSVFLDPNRVRSWEEVRTIKMPNQERSDNGRLLGSYDVLTTSGYEHELTAEDIDDAEPIYYFVGESNKNVRWTRSRTQKAAPYHHLLRSLEPGCTTVLIPATREAKLLRTFPDAKPVQEAVKGLFQEWLDGLSADEELALWIYEHHNASWDMLRHLDADRVDDPDLANHVRLTQSDKIDIDALNTQLGRYQAAESYDAGSSRCQLKVEWENPLERYPLYNHRLTYDLGADDTATKHLYVYLNAAYAATEDEVELEEAA